MSDLKVSGPDKIGGHGYYLDPVKDEQMHRQIEASRVASLTLEVAQLKLRVAELEGWLGEISRFTKEGATSG